MPKNIKIKEKELDKFDWNKLKKDIWNDYNYSINTRCDNCNLKKTTKDFLDTWGDICYKCFNKLATVKNLKNYRILKND